MDDVTIGVLVLIAAAIIGVPLVWSLRKSLSKSPGDRRLSREVAEANAEAKATEKQRATLERS